MGENDADNVLPAMISAEAKARESVLALFRLSLKREACCSRFLSYRSFRRMAASRRRSAFSSAFRHPESSSPAAKIRSTSFFIVLEDDSLQKYTSGAEKQNISIFPAKFENSSFYS